MHATVAPHVLGVAPDRNGGVTAALPASPSLRLDVHGGPLRAALLTVPEEVECLDLRALAEDAWISLRGAAGLRVLLLPQRPGPAGGADVQLDLAAAPKLQVDGPLAGLGACWTAAGRFRGWRSQAPRKEASWRRLYLGDGDPPPGTQALLFTGQPLDGCIDLRHLAPLAVLELVCPEADSVSVGAVDRLLISDALAVGYLRSEHHARIRVQRAPRLHTLVVRSHSVQLTDCGDGGGLDIAGSVISLGLLRPHYREVRAPGASEVWVDSAFGLARVVGGPMHKLELRGGEIVEAPNAACVQLHAADAERLQRMVAAGGVVAGAAARAMVDSVDGDAGAQACVTALRLARSGGALSAAEAWELRARLRRRLDHRRDHQDGPALAQAWRWSFPPDLADRGWSDDLALWLACRDEAPAAAAHGEVIRRCTAIGGFNALAAAIPDNPSCAPLLEAALRAPPPRGRARHPERGLWDHERIDPEQGFTRLIRLLIRARGAVDAACLADALAQHLRHRCRHGVPVLGVLAALKDLGAPAASAALAALATDVGVDDALRRQAFVHLIAPPHPDARPLFAPTASPEPCP